MSADRRIENISDSMYLSDTVAGLVLAQIRWGGPRVCPKCKWDGVTKIKTRNVYRCRASCGQFTDTSGTILHCTKMNAREILAAAFLFCDGITSSSNAAAKELIFQQKSIWVLFHKFRQAIGQAIGSGDQEYETLYAYEKAWKLAHQHLPVDQRMYQLLVVVLRTPVSRQFAKYWQRTDFTRAVA
jgi:hypothetical protein